MEKEFNQKYSLSQALNSSLLASMLVFASVYLLDKGFTNSTIGLIIAFSSVLSIFIQTFFAKITDKYKEITLQEMLMAILGIILVASITLLINPTYILFLIAVIISYSFIQSTVPFLNVLTFVFEEHGIKINFGVGRAFGSFAYAIVTLILGYIIDWTNPSILPIFYIVVTLGFIVLVRSFRLPEPDPNLGEMKTETVPIDKVTVPQNRVVPDEGQSLKDFLTKYQALFMAIVGVGFAMLGQNMLATFLFQVVEPLGGTSATVGVAISIGAMVEVPVLMKMDWLLEKRSAAFWLKISMFSYIAKALIMLFASNLPLIYMAQIFQAGSYAFAYPSAVQYINSTVAKSDSFKGQTLFTIAVTVSSVFANLLGGVLIDSFGLTQMIFFALIATFIGAIITYWVLINEPSENKLRVPQKDLYKNHVYTE